MTRDSHEGVLNCGIICRIPSLALMSLRHLSYPLLLAILLLAQPTAGLVNCREEFSALEFDLAAFDKYPFYFRDDSRMIVAQAGKYVGASAIAEYVSFSHSTGPYVKDIKVMFQTMQLKELNETDTTCTFIYKVIRRAETEPSLAKEATFLVGNMLQIQFDYTAGYIKEIDALFTGNFLEFIFGNILHTERTRDFICGVSEGCQDTNIGMSRSECMQRLESLPTFSTDTNSFDGNDYACRALHAAFARNNPDHCAHISFEPQKDPKGNIKCQTSKHWVDQDFFDQRDIDDFQEFILDEEFQVESSDGYRILSIETTKPSKFTYVLVGFIDPILLMIGIYLIVKKKEAPTEEDGKPSSSLAKNWLGNRLNPMIFVILLTLVLGYGIVLLVIQWVARQLHWDEYGGTPESPFVDRYRGDALAVTETVPQTLMSDDQFTVYTAIFIWLTCLISGFGLELFFWRYYLQDWTDSLEAQWRFAQFLVPLLALTSFGLALYGNFLFLPFCVLGSWKCGFPESFMSIYLGLYSKRENRQRRLADFLDGIGTILHHSAASLIVSMIVTDPEPSSPVVRYAANPIFFLIMQHWTIMISYVNMPLYAAIQLGLEWYFEWSLFSDLAHHYYLHWVFAMGSGAMLVAHWLYLLSAFISLFDGGDSLDTRENVFVRGIDLMSQEKETINGVVSIGLEDAATSLDDSERSFLLTLGRRDKMRRSSSSQVFHDGSIREV